MQTLSVDNYDDNDDDDDEDDNDDDHHEDKSKDITWRGRSMVPSIAVLFHIRPGAGQ